MIVIMFAAFIFISCADDLKAVEWTSSEISSSSGASSSSSLNYVQQVSSSSFSSSSYEQSSSSGLSSSSSSYVHSSSSGVSEKCEWIKGGPVIEATAKMALVNGTGTVSSNKGCQFYIPPWTADNMLITATQCGVDCPSIKIKNPHDKIMTSYFFIDTRDEQIYQFVEIKGKRWMAENLNYDGDVSNKYGKLYNWGTAKEACPNGWRLPNDQELSDLVGISVWGGDSKPISRDHAITLTPCNEGDCNSTGFTALAQGENPASWWGIADQGEYAKVLKINIQLPYELTDNQVYFDKKTNSHSVRCVRN
jgi:uncharacterized protein (TIGR02145 family)